MYKQNLKSVTRCYDFSAIKLGPLSPTAQGLTFSWGIVGYLETGLRGWMTLYLEQNTGTTEHDTLMGADVGSDVICRLIELGYWRGNVSGTLTCVHDNANCRHQISYETRQGKKHLKILPAPLEFWVAFPQRLMSCFWHFQCWRSRLPCWLGFVKRLYNNSSQLSNFELMSKATVLW